ncbi:MAG: PDDEXK nuclease domain-containing protein [Methanotrichaceae archaeon]|nr:PDDEXK nuclease domain-containing protein [Methanotrichaceae archaeon]
MNDEQIKLLLDKFVVSEEARTWKEQRWEDHKRWKEWIDPYKLETLPDDELKNKFLEYFNEGAGRHPFNAIYRDRIVRDIKKFREVIKFLLDESIPVREKLNKILYKDGIYHIDGIGKGLATSILMDLDPQNYAIWNNKTNMGLEALGSSPQFAWGDDWGTRYEKVMKVIRHVRELKPELSFLEIDHFLHIVSATEEGKEAVEALIEGKEIDVLVSETMSQISTERKEMEFVMEKYLEEFIEVNFDRIDFGAKLELYQDEEHSGRQYHTSIGNIDLLAIDRDNKKFVVIELKKGRSSDEVIGQILRYMGWVKENLAMNDYEKYDVRGIIISKEKDDKLEYALKMLPNTNVFLYSVSFELKDPLRSPG